MSCHNVVLHTTNAPDTAAGELGREPAPKRKKGRENACTLAMHVPVGAKDSRGQERSRKEGGKPREQEGERGKERKKKKGSMTACVLRHVLDRSVHWHGFDVAHQRRLWLCPPIFPFTLSRASIQRALSHEASPQVVCAARAAD